jgi:hypothetical protein
MRRWFAMVVAALLALALLPPCPAQELSKRLILKDGSYQAATKWEVKGNRVRYYSAERNEWEEMPYSLVDWEATNKYNQARESGAPPPEIQQQVDKELEADTADQAPTPHAAPGLNLPDFEGVFVLDTYQGQPQLLEMQQTAGDLNRNLKRNILTATINPLSAGKQIIELKGEHAGIQVHTPRPTFFINSSDVQQMDDKTRVGQQSPAQPPSKSTPKYEPEQPQQPQQPRQTVDQHYRLVRLQTKTDKRILGDLKIAIYGKVTQEQKFVPSTAERLTGNWVKITPADELQPGEYAVVEMLSPKEMNLEVWDFGVNPAAPQNPGAWKPAPPAPKPASKEPPLLQSRPESQPKN